MKIQNPLSGRPQWNRFSRSWLIADKPSSRSSPAALSRAKENPGNPCPVNSWTLHYAAASEHLERAVELARATFIPGWLGNLHLGLAEHAFDRNRFGDAKIFARTSSSPLQKHPSQALVGRNTSWISAMPSHTCGWQPRVVGVSSHSSSRGNRGWLQQGRGLRQ